MVCTFNCFNYLVNLIDANKALHITGKTLKSSQQHNDQPPTDCPGLTETAVCDLVKVLAGFAEIRICQSNPSHLLLSLRQLCSGYETRKEVLTLLTLNFSFQSHIRPGTHQ
jgi:hypothetical protein